MPRSRFALPVLLALPGLSLAVAGLFHPHHLTYDTVADVVRPAPAGAAGLPARGLALMVLVRGRRDPVAWVVRLTAYVYATFYSALDVISGVGAGYVTHELGPDVPRPDAVSLMFRIGTQLGRVGEYALLVCVVVLFVDQLVRRGVRALPGVLLVPGRGSSTSATSSRREGVAGMTLLGLATGWLAWVAATRGVDPDTPNFSASGGNRNGVTRVIVGTESVLDSDIRGSLGHRGMGQRWTS